MLRSLSPKPGVDFHLLKSLGSSVPTSPLLSLLCDLDGVSWTFLNHHSRNIIPLSFRGCGGFV